MIYQRRNPLDLQNGTFGHRWTNEQQRSRKPQKGMIVKSNVCIALYSPNDITITSDGRHRTLQTIFFNIPGVEWIQSLQQWVFSADQQTYKRVLETLSRHYGTFDINSLPDIVYKQLPLTTEQLLLERQRQERQEMNWKKQRKLNPNDDDDDDDDDDNEDDAMFGDDDDTFGDIHNHLEGDENNDDWMGNQVQQNRIKQSILWQSLTAEQQSKVKKGVQLQGNVYMHDSAGSGKSLQALALAMIYQEDWPALIICPKSVCLAWKNLVQKMLSLDSNQVYIIDTKGISLLLNGTKKRSRKLEAEYSTKAAAIRSRKRREMVRLRKSMGINAEREENDPSSRKNKEASSEELYISIKDDSGDYYSEDNDDDNDNLYISIKDDGGDYTYSNGNDDANMDFTSKSETNGAMTNDTNDIPNPESAQLYIIDYDNMAAHIHHIVKKKFKILIFDDCHKIKSTLLRGHRSPVVQVVKEAKKTIMVTETPVIPRPMESFALLQLLKPALFEDHRSFGKRYCDAKHAVFGWDYSGKWKEWMMDDSFFFFWIFDHLLLLIIGQSNSFELKFLLDRTLLV
ncbi:uncharacterized protein BX664DRAFT_185180 [Halteromyces radiatus]|uniref:uncharacterized protein n=1 Tax=Halteromyces radiatus TaxID=101107 RepID=UPI002220865B|nr:uncharacterized protein BX664DRAFT_185180 [Halteromyces radiatus]KAI8082879.1 hypothetical protein BX664DRAFT_185180 [Halteromyces radiatus]